MESNFDSESYWNRSTLESFSFDDENDFSPTTGSGGVSTGTRKWDVDSSSILNDDAISEASFDNSTSSALNLSIKSVISDEALKTILMEQSLDDRIITKGVTPEEELKILRRQIQTTLYNPSPEATAYKLLLGKTVTLEVFKSLHEKEQLLDAVLKNGGGDAVIGVLLFLRKTLNRTNFYRIMQQRPKSLEHYVSYLKKSTHFSEAVEFLHNIGRVQEAALTQFQAALAAPELQTRKQKLHQLVERFSNEAGVISLYKQTFSGSLKLLELVDKERNSLDNLVNLNSTPIEVLYACCRKNTNWKEQDLLSTRLCTEQQISAAQFEWTALNERTKYEKYADLENIFERMSTWHPMKQKQFHISFSLDLAILRLHELKAPATVLYMFLSKVSNSSEKLELAQRVKCTKAIIDALVSLKDSNQLTQLRDSLPERTEEQFYCEKALKGLQSKRWSTDNIKLKL